MTRVRAAAMSTTVLSIALGAGVAVHAVALTLGRTVPADPAGWSGLRGPGHLVIEVVGGAIALFVAWLLVALARQGRGAGFDRPIAGLLAALVAGSGILVALGAGDGPWTALHGLELAAHLVALGFAFRSELRSRAHAERTSEELKHLNATLAERVSAHTAELEVALELAQSASRAKSEFLANMSHEIRTPLNAVIGLTEVVLDTELSDFQRDHLRTVLEAGDALLNVINDILDFSKIEAGKLRIDAVPFHLEDAICDTLKALAIRAHRKGLELTCYVDPAAPRWIRGDPGRLRQVITNLVSNAITYTEEGEVFVRVAREAGASRLHVAVLDSGIGIEPRQLERLFGSFEQADSSTTRRFGGTGLGLAISRELVRLMGGEIRAESVPRVGSTFSFTLPCEVPAEVADAEAREREASWGLDDVRVLIVDDNTTNRTTLDALARSQGMRTVLAESAERAFRRLLVAEERGDPVRVVVSDVEMPEVDGFALAERIRASVPFARLPIVLLTSAVLDAQRSPSAKLGVQARLMKPVKPAELFEALAAAVDASSAARVAEPRAEAASPAACERAPEPSEAAPGSGHRILLVEDSVPNRKLALALLAGRGHTIRVAENGRVAVDWFEREEFDLVLMDVQMPEMDGLQATAAIRAAEAATGRRVPIVAMTAHALAGDREKCLAAGMDDYLTKPIRRAELEGALARLGWEDALRPRGG